MHDIDPYATPQEDPEPAEAGESWYVVMRAVHVRHGTSLPPVDLETGETNAALVPVKVKVREHPRALRLLPVFGAVWSLSLVPDGYRQWMLLGLIMIIGISGIAKKRLPSLDDRLTFTMFRNHAMEKTAKRLVFIRRGLLACSFVAALVACFTFVPGNWWFYGLIFAFPLLMILFQNREYGVLKIRPFKAEPQWVRISNIDLQALKALEDMEKSRGPIFSIPKSSGSV